MIIRPVLALTFIGFSVPLANAAPLRALLVCGGCCHDYEKQSVILRDGIQARADIQVDVVRSLNSGTKPYFPMYENKDWAKGYDVIIHDECAAEIKDPSYVQNILDAHKGGIPAVNVHCAMHSYRTGTDTWFTYLGLQSSSHAWRKPISLDFTAAQHVITEGFENWTTTDEELYNNIKIFDTAKPLVMGSQLQSNGKTDTNVVAWTNDYHGTRSFNTTLGHTNETVSDGRYLDLIVRGVLWSCDKLDKAHLQPYKGPAGKLETVPADAGPPAAANAAPIDASVAASSTNGKVGAGFFTKPAATPAAADSTVSVESLAKSGNRIPSIEPLTPAREAEILKDVTAAPGFDVSLFATPSAANYPVYIAAAPNGDLYVSSDGNGSLGREPSRGRIIRLRDTDHDGRADEAKEFVKNLDSPRGLVWDHDRLYVIHPPDISVFIDKDGDGVSDEQKTLISGIAFGFKDRPADHTTNGLSLGIDGWLYISGGDFGFQDAIGSDGKHLQHRAGGVIRFRPDGSNLEIFSTGTRNILGTPISPLLDIFARDNTNDGGGWDVRFHHFTGLEDHGYPRMYMNFSDEIIQPLADYGGGSGCGSVYLSEPGFPDEWNNAPLTCDWGTGALWHHTVQPKGATFEETVKPQPLIKMTRPTDADVDGMSNLYQASWKGATFKWEGPDVGYIVRVSPKGYSPAPLPDFNGAPDAELIKMLDSPSQVRTMEAQRALLRRPDNKAMLNGLLLLAKNPSKPLPARVAALYCISQRALKSEFAQPAMTAILPLAKDEKLGRFVLRALGDAGLDGFLKQKTTAPEAPFSAGFKSSDPRTRLEAIVGATRQNMKSLAPEIAGLLGDADPVVAHTAFRGIAMLNAPAPCFAILNDSKATPAQRTGAMRALMRMHQPEVISGLLTRLENAPATSPQRQDLVAGLCRLHFREGEWKGDSWGTRPDTRGPYYQPEPWSETPKIAAFLAKELAAAGTAEAPRLIQELRRNRIEIDGAFDRMLAMTQKNPGLLPDLIAQLASMDSVPQAAIPVLINAAKADLPSAVLAQVVSTLTKTDSAEGCTVSLTALAKLVTTTEGNAAKKIFLLSPKLENYHQLLEDTAAKNSGVEGTWADAALIALSSRQQGSPESRELSTKALNDGWTASPKRRLQILNAMFAGGAPALESLVNAAVRDPDPEVAKAASTAVKQFQLGDSTANKSPLVGSLNPDEVIAMILKSKGSIARGEQLFTSQTCTSCHAASLNEPQKGPYLGNIAQTYSRGELAANIIDPGKTIAQGFTTEIFTMKDGTSQMGFVTFESADTVKIRNIAAQEFTLKAAEITKRDKLPNSLMPPGLVSGITVQDFASLLDYLESLSAK